MALSGFNQSFLKELELVLKHELEAVKAEFKQELEVVKAGLEQKLNKQETATRQLELTLTHKIEELEQKLTIRLGSHAGCWHYCFSGT